MRRVLDLAANNVDNDEVVTILLRFMKDGGDEWMSRLGAVRRYKCINESFEKVYARMTTDESIDTSTKEIGHSSSSAYHSLDLWRVKPILGKKGEASKLWPSIISQPKKAVVRHSRTPGRGGSSRRVD